MNMEGTTPATSESTQVDAVVTSLSLLTLTPPAAPRSQRRGRPRCKPDNPSRLSRSTDEPVENTATPRNPSDSLSRPPPWGDDEIRALLSFILIYTEGNTWTARASRTDDFWDQAGVYVKEQVGSSYCRTGWLHCMYNLVFQLANFVGAACKWRVFRKLAREYESPLEAEHHLGSTQASCHMVQSPPQPHRTPTPPQLVCTSVLQARGLCQGVLDQIPVKEQLLVCIT